MFILQVKCLSKYADMEPDLLHLKGISELIILLI